ncbi:MAG: tRNA (adenosine(37)-N6)-threonylcarbamoyltransferase complex ATPase subunit type 1 TsaE [Firmicutes bacterium]|nr:tRNA (adenosine(37)-N6)-threonylcarbamoyltransferase complex ATPase subunit type 1 TsaE [Bacillota bacterium]
MRVEKTYDDTVRIWSENPADTEELGVVLGGILQPGDLFFLSGELGSGKTLFVRGLTQGMNSEELATSPTFALVHRYEGPLPLYHLDLYRLSGPEELEPLALEELLEEEAALVIEWGEPAKEVLPSTYMQVEFRRGEAENQRLITFLPSGERYRVINHLLAEELKKQAQR